MGLFRDHQPTGQRFQMQQKLASIGDDFWIEDDHGDHVYKGDGKAMRLRDPFILEDLDGNEVAKIQERHLTIRDTMKVERGGHTVATIHKAIVGIRYRFAIEIEAGDTPKAKGNFVDHEYEIQRDGDVVATVSKKWFRLPDSYGIV